MRGNSKPLCNMDFTDTPAQVRRMRVTQRSPSGQSRVQQTSEFSVREYWEQDFGTLA